MIYTLSLCTYLVIIRYACVATGTVPFRRFERIAFHHLIVSKFVGETCKLTLLRQGKLLEFTIPLARRKALVCWFVFDLLCRYCLVLSYIERAKPSCGILR